MTSITAHVRQASGNLLASGQRTLLALLGIVVGIGAVIALLTTGAMAKSEAVRQFESLGTDMLSVFDITRRTSVSTPQDVLRSSHAPELAGLATIAAASPYTLRSAELVLDDPQLGPGQLRGVRWG
ncbi:MAG: ABC transporter permease, partial [Gammaproteobacteria bacterium]|nr:ABC transporter permease [Gammaproteobacteria bacterium]